MVAPALQPVQSKLETNFLSGIGKDKKLGARHLPCQVYLSGEFSDEKHTKVI
jgi:hypothetical protein